MSLWLFEFQELRFVRTFGLFNNNSWVAWLDKIGLIMHQIIQHEGDMIIPGLADSRAISDVMLCSMICTRSSLLFEGGHHISVNLFRKAGDS